MKQKISYQNDEKHRFKTSIWICDFYRILLLWKHFSHDQKRQRKKSLFTASRIKCFCQTSKIFVSLIKQNSRFSILSINILFLSMWVSCSKIIWTQCFFLKKIFCRFLHEKSSHQILARVMHSRRCIIDVFCHNVSTWLIWKKNSKYFDTISIHFRKIYSNENYCWIFFCCVFRRWIFKHENFSNL